MGQIHRLARQGDLAEIRRLLDGADDVRVLANEIDASGWTPLYYAVVAVAPSVDVVSALLEAGADPAFIRIEVMEDFDFDFDEELDADPSETEPDSLEPDSPKETIEFRNSLLSAALKRGSLEVVRLLRDSGADLNYRTDSDYTAILDAVYGVEERLPLIRYLIGLGLDVETPSSYGETPIGTAYRFAQWNVVAELLATGTNADPFGWTPIHRAVAIGTDAEFAEVLRTANDLRAYDRHGVTALHIALRKGDRERIEGLLAHGADLDQRSDSETSSLEIAVESGDPVIAERLVTRGVSSEDRDSALHTAVESGRHAVAEVLLQAGGDPAFVGEHVYPVLEVAPDGEMIRLLFRYGADPSALKAEGRRKLLGLPDVDPDDLSRISHEAYLDHRFADKARSRPELLSDPFQGVSREEYLEHRYVREGRSNPEEMSDPFRLAMIRSGVHAHRARQEFEDPRTFTCALDEEDEESEREPAIWCFDRFGQSTTILPDGRIVLIAGEHEDFYDPEFHIYNDVVVFDPPFDGHGLVRVYGYPATVFPSTDFHSATLVGEWIYIVGSLGYSGYREGPVPVHRLAITDFRIEPVMTTGEVPGTLFDHRTALVGDSVLRVSGGTLVTVSDSDSEESHDPNPDVYELDLASRVWTKR